MHKTLKLLVYTMPLWLFSILLYLMNTTDPVSAGPGGILLTFVIIYLIVASLLFTLLHWGVRAVSSQLAKRRTRITLRSYKMGVRKAYYIASAVAFGPVLLLALNSVRQLNVTDIILVSLFLGLAIFYITKRES